MNMLKGKASLKVGSVINQSVMILGKYYNLKISYKNTKLIELNLEYNDIHIYLPNKYKRIDKESILKIAIEKMYTKIAKQEIERIMEKTRLMLGFAPEDYEIKIMKKALTKCTKDKKIIINPNIIKYDIKTIETIILHEYCHLKYRPNSKRFIDTIKKYMPNYENYIYAVSEMYY